jgi:hypothetical protein
MDGIFPGRDGPWSIRFLDKLETWWSNTVLGPTGRLRTEDAGTIFFAAGVNLRRTEESLVGMGLVPIRSWLATWRSNSVLGEDAGTIMLFAADSRPRPEKRTNFG